MIVCDYHDHNFHVHVHVTMYKLHVYYRETEVSQKKISRQLLVDCSAATKVLTKYL